MAIFRQYVAPLIVVLVFLVALLAVSARIFLPNDMAAPAPIEEIGFVNPALSDEVAGIPSSLETLVKGLPVDPGAQL
jgi:hypothetical protein